METMQLPLTDSLKTFVETQASKRGLPSPVDYVQQVLLALEQRDKAKMELEEKLREGLRSPMIEADEAFWREMEREFFEKHPEQKSCDE
jgi:hypothetical protein